MKKIIIYTCVFFFSFQSYAQFHAIWETVLASQKGAILTQLGIELANQRAIVQKIDELTELEKLLNEKRSSGKIKQMGVYLAAVKELAHCYKIVQDNKVYLLDTAGTNKKSVRRNNYSNWIILEEYEKLLNSYAMDMAILATGIVKSTPGKNYIAYLTMLEQFVIIKKELNKIDLNNNNLNTFNKSLQLQN